MDTSQQQDSSPSHLTSDDGPSSMTIDVDPALNRDLRIISICTASSRSGCAIYCDSTIHLVADRRDPGDPYKGLDLIIQRVDPDVVIVPAAQKNLITFLEKIFHYEILDITKQERSSPDIVDPAFTVAIAPNNWFSLSHGEEKLIESEWVKNQGFTEAEQKPFFVFSKIKKSIDVCAVRAISAIDKYLGYEFTADTRNNQMEVANFDSSIEHQLRTLTSQISCATRTTATEEHRIVENLMPIIEAKYIDPGPILSVDKGTLQTLGILPNDSQRPPQVVLEADFQPIPSLYDILNQCQSTQGKKTLRTIMMWPLQDLEELRHRQEVVDFFVRSENKLFRDQLLIQLKNIVPLSGLLTKLNQSVGTYKELSILYRSLWSFVAIIDLIRSYSSYEIELLNRIVELDSTELRVAIDSITNIIDFEASKREKRIQVCVGVDQSVDEKKEVVKHLMKFCDEVGIQETAKYKDILGKTCRVQYIPRIGFLNSIEYFSTAELTAMSTNKEFDILLHTEQSVYFKTKRMEELDNNAGDIACDLIDVQEAVVVKLQNDILKYTELIMRLMELCGELDCFIAFSIVSLQRGYTRPDFGSSTDEMEIREAYHPMQCTKHNVVPNDIKFFKDSTQNRVKVMIITGPNSCGKTTYMKIACLVVYMAHIGCFVPALYAKIPIMDAILTRMHSANSISTGLSSFAMDLHQINYALSRATSRSLLAIDEFGKGTQAHDGLHLLKGLIGYFARQEHDSPYVMITTHYNRLIDHLEIYSQNIIYKTFKVTRDLARDSIIYEFKLADGVSETSLADQVAAEASIPEALIRRANQIRECLTEGRSIQPRPAHAA